MRTFAKFLMEADIVAGQHDALEKWVNENNLEGKRIHLAPENLNPYDKSQAMAPGYMRLNSKPFGLWYALGSTWLQHIVEYYQKRITNIIYEIDINPSSVLMVKDTAHARLLEKEFGVWKDFRKYGWHTDQAHTVGGYGGLRGSYNPNTGEHNTDARPVLLDWARMTKVYDGVELDPDNVEAFWAEGWEVASGCIWNKKGIKNYQILARFDPKTNLYR